MRVYFPLTRRTRMSLGPAALLALSPFLLAWWLAYLAAWLLLLLALAVVTVARAARRWHRA